MKDYLKTLQTNLEFSLIAEQECQKQKLAIFKNNLIPMRFMFEAFCDIFLLNEQEAMLKLQKIYYLGYGIFEFSSKKTMEKNMATLMRVAKNNGYEIKFAVVQ